MDVTFKIGTLDLHSVLSTYNVRREVSYQDMITTLDNVEHVFPNPPRTIIEFDLFPLTDLTATELYDNLSALIVSVTFSDPYSNAVISGKTMYVNSDFEAVFGLKSIDGNRYYKGGAIELRAV